MGNGATQLPLVPGAVEQRRPVALQLGEMGLDTRSELGARIAAFHFRHVQLGRSVVFSEKYMPPTSVNVHLFLITFFNCSLWLLSQFIPEGGFLQSVLKQGASVLS